MRTTLQPHTADTLYRAGQSLIIGGVLSGTSALGATVLLAGLPGVWRLAGGAAIVAAVLSIVSGLQLCRMRPLHSGLVQLGGLLASSSGMFLGAAVAYLLTFNGWGVGMSKVGYQTVLEAGRTGALYCGLFASLALLPGLGQRLHASLDASRALAVQSLVLGISLALLSALYWLAPTLLESIESPAQVGISLDGMREGHAAALTLLSAVSLVTAAMVFRTQRSLRQVVNTDLTALIDAQEAHALGMQPPEKAAASRESAQAPTLEVSSLV